MSARSVFDTGRVPRNRWLLCDADDTLWENNIYFEQAIDEFVAFVGHPTLSPAEVRAELDAVEERNIRLNGYGTANFARNLVECFGRLRDRSASECERRRLVAMTDRIRHSPMRLVPGVRETLEALVERYWLGLVTKGQIDEQRDKVRRSGLEHLFDYVKYTREKDAECYRAVIRDIGADPSETWMIGNSPKSDINPALETGLGAVLVPHRNTWSLEQQEIRESHGRFRRVRRFSDLTSIF